MHVVFGGKPVCEIWVTEITVKPEPQASAFLLVINDHGLLGCFFLNIFLFMKCMCSLFLSL